MRSRWYVIVALGLVGLVWIGQGTGVIRGQGFMTDDLRWAAIGAVLVVIALVMGLDAWRRRRA